MQKDLFDPPTNQARERRRTREKNFGPRLDRMRAPELWRLCNSVFPDWPRVFGRRFTIETARQDGVLRRLLLFALEYPPTIDTKHTASAAVALKE